MITTGIIVFVLIVLDQLTKYLAQLYAPNSFVCIPNFLTFDLTYNKGAAWGMLSDNTPILVLVSFVATIVLGYLCYKNDWKKAKFSSLAISLALAGCVGNLIDRFMACVAGLNDLRPGVVDMISFEPLNFISKLISGSNFPIFNLADIFLVVGLIMYCIDLVFFAEKREKVKNEENSN